MKHIKILGYWSAALMLLAAAGTGCARTRPARLYALPVSEALAPAAGVVRAVVLAPVQIPAYLERAPLVSRNAGGEVLLDDYSRWAEPLEDALSARLALYLEGAGATVYTSASRVPSGVEAARVQVRFHRFEREPDGQVVLDAVATVEGGVGLAAGQSRRFVLRRPIEAGQARQGEVRALGLALQGFAAELCALVGLPPAGN